MMDQRDMILLKGEPKTREIISVNKDKNDVYWVKFNSGKTFPYSNRDVKILKSPKELDLEDCRLVSQEGTTFNPLHAWVFHYRLKCFYRVEFPNDIIREYTADYLRLRTSVLANPQARKLFEYFKGVAGIQVIKTEAGNISLHDKYDKIHFVDSESALGCYLCPAKMTTHKGFEHLLFPFYSNLSQMQAVENAFKSQVSVIQGPPGTGKTQTILNIVANVLAQRKTVLIVSNNNSAVENVREKLEKAGLGFLVAGLGKSDNRNAFIEEKQAEYPAMDNWKLDNYSEVKKEVDDLSSELRGIFERQNRLAECRQELTDIEVESKHFFAENHIDFARLSQWNPLPSPKLVDIWVQIDMQKEVEDSVGSSGVLSRFLSWYRNRLTHSRLKKIFGDEIIEDEPTCIKALFYVVRKQELQNEISEITDFLNGKQARDLLERQAAASMQVLKHVLFKKYGNSHSPRPHFNRQDLLSHGKKVADEYPVVLSTTFSAVSCLPGYLFDFLIMDEASQVPVESAALALSCAKNAVIVGDLKQLPNIITSEARGKIQELNDANSIDDNYNCVTNSFLASIIKVLPDAPQTLLREHYRCAPLIINYCNQRFYGGELIIMTQTDTDSIPMKVIKTVPGNHARSVKRGDEVYVFNQREVDEFKQLLHAHPNCHVEDIGIIAPYKGQALLFRHAVNDKRLEADTIHKYQGREKDVIVMSTVADEYNDFVDDPNLINVAVSRAKKEFVLITNGNETSRPGNLKDLIDYIAYNHGEVTQSHLHSIFDLLYATYAKRRENYLKGKKRVSQYDSENIAYHVIRSILKRNENLVMFDVIPHYHLNALISDTVLLTDEEKEFAKASWSHVDFLIENRVSKCPVLVIEVDGFAYHHKGTRQAERDKIKNSILNKYHIPLLRLSTVGSDEETEIENALKGILCV